MAECAILYGDKFIKKITVYSTTAGIEVIDDKHSLLHNFVDTVYYKYLMNWTHKKIDEEVNDYKTYLAENNHSIPTILKKHY
jgi:hypothetical protein